MQWQDSPFWKCQSYCKGWGTGSIQYLSFSASCDSRCPAPLSNRHTFTLAFLLLFMSPKVCACVFILIRCFSWLIFSHMWCLVWEYFLCSENKQLTSDFFPVWLQYLIGKTPRILPFQDSFAAFLYFYKVLILHYIKKTSQNKSLQGCLF